MLKQAKRLEIHIQSRISESSGGSELVQFIQSKLRLMKEGELIRESLDVMRRYENGELFKEALKQKTKCLIEDDLPRILPELIIAIGYREPQSSENNQLGKNRGN